MAAHLTHASAAQRSDDRLGGIQVPTVNRFAAVQRQGSDVRFLHLSNLQPVNCHGTGDRSARHLRTARFAKRGVPQSDLLDAFGISRSTIQRTVGKLRGQGEAMTVDLRARRVSTTSSASCRGPAGGERISRSSNTRRSSFLTLRIGGRSFSCGPRPGNFAGQGRHPPVERGHVSNPQPPSNVHCPSRGRSSVAAAAAGMMKSRISRVTVCRSGLSMSSGSRVRNDRHWRSFCGSSEKA